MKSKDTYKEVITMSFPDSVIRIHIPDISKEERSSRMNSIHKAAAELLKQKERGLKKYV